MYTWIRGNPGIGRRLDYIFVGQNIKNNVKSADIKTIGFSDHRAVMLTMEWSKTENKNSFYKLNIKHLSDIKYVNMIKKTIQDTSRQYEGILDPHLKWEMIKIEVKETSQKYSRFICNRKKRQEKILRDELNELENKFTNLTEDRQKTKYKATDGNHRTQQN